MTPCKTFLHFSFFVIFISPGLTMTIEAKNVEEKFAGRHSGDKTNPTLEIQVLRAAYAAFNARDISTALKLMNADITWPKAFKGGFVQGSDEIRKYWTEQWSEINPHVEPIAFYPQNDSQILVDVHQIVRNLEGSVLADEHVGHLFTIKNGLIQTMEISSLP